MFILRGAANAALSLCLRCCSCHCPSVYCCLLPLFVCVRVSVSYLFLGSCVCLSVCAFLPGSDSYRFVTFLLVCRFFLSFSTCFCVYLSVFMSVCLPSCRCVFSPFCVCFIACLRVCLPACLSVSLTCVSLSFVICFSACVCLSACLSVHVSHIRTSVTLHTVLLS